MEGDGPVPQELVDAQLIERFGWTFDELDSQDMGRVFRAVSIMNASKMYGEIVQAIRAHKPNALGKEHWELYKMMRDASNGP